MPHNTIADVWDDPKRPWPSIVYVQTTNRCNAMCACCPNDKVQRKRGTMGVETFKGVADKVKARGLKIGAMFCFGEPLMDPTLEEKYAYATSIGVLTGHVGLNTNVSYLTPDRWDSILEHTPNIILSFFNTGTEFETLTKLRWDDCYEKAKAFIEYRDRRAPSYPIFIGVNKVPGHDLDMVKAAFSGCRVQYVQDNFVDYSSDVAVIGVADRMVMHNGWRCDGFKGALHVQEDLGCEYCGFDVVASETRFGNFLEDSWEDLERNFREKWRSCSSLCKRCDYWYLCKAVIDNGFRPVEDDTWKKNL